MSEIQLKTQQHARRAYYREQTMWRAKWSKVKSLIEPTKLIDRFLEIDSDNAQFYEDLQYSDEAKTHETYRKKIQVFSLVFF